jgi:hypothetical protein
MSVSSIIVAVNAVLLKGVEDNLDLSLLVKRSSQLALPRAVTAVGYTAEIDDNYDDNRADNQWYVAVHTCPY